MNNVVRADETITDAQRAAAGLPVHKTTRTPVGAPQSAPMLARVDNEHLLQRLWFADSTTPGSRAKPAGVAFCEIRQAILPASSPAPTDPDGMAPLATDSKAPHRTDFSADEVGHVAYYALRWLSTRGAPGPWSTVSAHPVI